MQRVKKVLGVFSFAALAAIATTANAEEIGQAEFGNACASCHGESGKGNGYLAGFLSVGLPDLTTLSQRNDGKFPMLDVIHIIDGRTGVRTHGDAGMPVWGDRYKADAEAAGSYGSETITRGRILSLVYYLESIQE